jgi:hypothetical protein
MQNFMLISKVVKKLEKFSPKITQTTFLLMSKNGNLQISFSLPLLGTFFKL